MSADVKLKAYIDRILRCREAEDEAKQDTKEVYAELAAEGYEKAIVGQVVTFLRKREKDGDKVAEQSAKFDLYLEAYERPSHAHTREDRSDAGLNILTKHTETTASDGASPAVRQLAGSARDEESAASISPETATQSLASGPCEAVSERTATQVEAVASAEAGVSGQPEMIPATSAESAADERDVEADGGAALVRTLPDQTAEQAGGGGHEVATGSAMRAGLADPASNIGEGAACAFPAKSILRPLCRNPGETCGGYGSKHCHACLIALEEEEAA